MGIDGKAVAAIGVGAVFVWSGIKGWSVLGTASDLLAGRTPTGTNANPLTNASALPGGESGITGAGVAINTSISTIATQYVGHAYSYGGAPGRNGQSPWDCSSFVNYVVGVVAGSAIPGYSAGKYDGTSHGPPTGTWGVWPGLESIDKSQIAAGDIVVWLNHMGICLSGDTMISALNAREGTKITPIDGYGNGPLLKYGRLTVVPPGGRELSTPGLR